METRYCEVMPDCDICSATDLEVAYDMPYSGRHWANVCEECRTKADDPDHRAGFKIIKGSHPNADLSHAKLSQAMTPQHMLERQQRRAKEKAYIDNLTMDEVEAMILDSVVETADGCQVEPDGRCPHGYSSPLLLLHMM